jgi:Protein of Unknown function (DUF2784)
VKIADAPIRRSVRCNGLSQIDDRILSYEDGLPLVPKDTASAAMPNRLLADAVLALHVAFIFFVVGGLVVVVVGNLRSWSWVNGWWFRATHLAAIGFVVAESWLDVPCPFTTLEAWLRPREAEQAYSQGFIAHWLHRLFSYETPPWVFSTTDAGIGLLTLLAWWYFPPRRRRDTSSAISLHP